MAPNHQCTLALDPPAPGVTSPSSDIFSPGTVALDLEVDSPVVASSDDAQAESSNAIAKTNTVRVAKRSLTATNLTLDMFDATPVFDRFRGDECGQNRYQISPGWRASGAASRTTAITNEARIFRRGSSCQP